MPQPPSPTSSQQTLDQDAVINLHPVGPYNRRSFDIAPLALPDKKTSGDAPSSAPIANVPRPTRRPSMSEVLTSWLGFGSGDNSSSKDIGHVETAKAMLDSAGPEPVIKGAKVTSPTGDYFDRKAVEGRNGGTVSSPGIVMSTVDKTHPRVRVSIGDIVRKPSTGGVPKREAGSINEGKEQNGGSLAQRCSEALYSLVTDVIANGSVNDKHTQSLPTAFRTDISAVVSQMGDLVRKHYTQPTSPGTDGQKSIPEHLQLMALVTQMSAILSSPVFVPMIIQARIESEVETITTQWFKTVINSPSNAYIHFPAATNDRFAATAFAIKSALSQIEKNGDTPASIPVIYHADDINAEELERNILRYWSNIGDVLGFEKARIRRVATLPNGETIDLIALEQLISQDIADGKKPCMVIGRAGTPVTGEVDSLKGLRMLCDKMGVWLHVEGPLLASLLVSETAAELKLMHEADSFVLDFGKLFGLFGFPPMPILRTPPPATNPESSLKPALHLLDQTEQAVRHTAIPLHTEIKNGRLVSEYVSPALTHSDDTGSEPRQSIVCTLPFWSATQVVDLGGVKKRVIAEKELIQVFIDLVSKTPALKTLSPPDACVHSVLVRFDASVLYTEPTTASTMDSTVFVEENQRVTKYLYVHIPDDLKTKLGISLVSVGGIVYIRYTPHAAATLIETQSIDMHAVATHIATDAKKISTTIQLRTAFREIGEARRELSFIDSQLSKAVDNDGEEVGEDVWVGFGALRYTPLYVDLSAPSIAPEVITNLDGLNAQLASRLNEKYTKEGEDRLFSGCLAVEGALPAALTGSEGVAWCVRVGLAAEEFSVEKIKKLVDEVVREGVKLERDGEFVAKIADVIRKGIEEAERQLQNESAEEQPSILRMLPIVGSVLSWWRPEVPRNRIPVAKTFSIATGFTTVPLDPNSPGSRGSISLSRQDSVVSNGSVSALRNGVEREEGKEVGMKNVKEVEEEKEETKEVVEQREDMPHQASDAKTNEALPTQTPDTPNTQPNVTIEEAIQTILEESKTPGDLPLLTLLTHLQTRYFITPTSHPTLYTTLDKMGITYPTDSEIEEGVRDILKEYESRMGELNNLKVRLHLEKKFGVDLKGRVGVIREVVDRCLGGG